METRQRLRWLCQTVGRLHALAPGPLWAAVGCSVLGQITLLLTLYLPFQVMLMLVTREVSRYFRWAEAWVAWDALVLWLVTAAVGMYGVYLACGRASQVSVAVAADRLLAHGKKLAMFKDDRQQAQRVVRRLVSWCVGALMWLVYAALGLWVDTPVFAAVLAGALAMWALVHPLCVRPWAAGPLLRARQWLRQHTDRALAVCNNGLFFLGFGVLFVQFLHVGGDMMTAILTLLLLRQMGGWLTRWVHGIVSLPALRHRVDALIDPRQHYAAPVAPAQAAFVDALAPATREGWLRAGLAQVLGAPCHGHMTCAWNDTGFLGLAAWDVRLDLPEAETRRYFVRCFSSALRQEAEHETHLFESPTPPPMAPHYLGRTEVDDVHVLVFEGLPAGRPSSADLAALRRRVHDACAAMALDARLANAYTRTHATLPHRLNALLLARLRAAATCPADVAAVSTLADALPAMRNALEHLPCVLDNPDVGLPFIRLTADGQPVVWQWQRWRTDRVHPHVPWKTPDPRAWASALGALERTARNGRPGEGLSKLSELLALWCEARQAP